MRSAVRVGVRPFPQMRILPGFQPLFQSLLKRSNCINFDKIAPDSVKIGAKLVQNLWLLSRRQQLSLL
ncbi:MAG: hypothetical protein AAFU84_22420, partial [Cyanobacteria bacterium J06633_23]